MTFKPDSRFSWFLEQFGEPQQSIEIHKDVISKYKNKLPDQLITYWIEYGFCCFKNGLFSIVNPDNYKSAIEVWLRDTDILTKDKYYAIARNGFGDLMLWGEKSGNNYTIEPRANRIFHEEGDEKRISIGKSDEAMQGFFATSDPDLTDLTDVNTDKPIFEDAVKKFGPLAHDEMFTFEPALFLGGEQTLANIKKVNIFIQLEILAKMGTPTVMDINGLAKKAFS